MGTLGSAKTGYPHVLYPEDMLGFLGEHVAPTGDMLPTLRKVHWLSSARHTGTVEHKLLEEVHSSGSSCKNTIYNIC